MKLLSATIATVVGAATADPAATVIAVPSQQTEGTRTPVHTVQAVHSPAPFVPQYVGQQPVYVAAQPVLVGTAGIGGAHQVVAQPLLEQQLMRSPQMATMTHLYNIPQTVAHTVPVVYQTPQVAEQAVQQVVRQDNQVVPVQVPGGTRSVPVVKKEGEVSQQFHSQDDFGNYAYGYTNDNSEKQEVGNTRSGQVKGHYTYVDGHGMNRRVDYVADNNGFHAKGDGIKIKRDAEPEPEAEPEAKPEAKPEAEAEAVHQQQPAAPKVQMTSYMKGAADQPEGMRMTSYMSNGAPLSLHDMQQMYADNLHVQSGMQQRTSPLMTYYNRPMVYMAMHGPSRGTLTATRTVDDMVDSYNMGDRRVDDSQMVNLRMGNVGERMESMRMGGDRRFDMINMRRNANSGRHVDNNMFYTGQYLNNNNLYRNRLMRNNMFKTNPSTFVEIQQFEMQPNRNYRFDF